MVSLPKISIGKKAKRNFFDLTHDVNTTSDFGFCQPTLCREFYKDSKITLQTKEFVRLGAMPCPTFGRIEVKTHTAFVPVRETFLAYDYLQSQKTVTSANRSYVPQCSDYVTANTLLGSLMDLAVDIDNYLSPASETIHESRVDLTRFIGRFSLWTQWRKFCPLGYEKYLEHGPDDWVDIVNDPVIITDQTLADNSVRLLASALSVDPESEQQTRSPLYDFLGNTQHFNKAYFGFLDTVSGQQRQTFNRLVMLNFAEYLPNRINPQLVKFLGHGYLGELAASYLIFPKHNPEFLQAFGPADFSFGTYEIVGYTDDWGNSVTGVPIRVDFHLSRTGRRLLKVFTGCRISFGTKNKKIDLMRLFSYYKVWFDKYNPGRNLQWLDTNCFGLIHGYYDYGSVLDNILLANGLDYQRIFNAGILNRYRAFWYKFVIDLAQCCYVLPVDNMTCATPTPLLEISDNLQSINSIGLYASNTNPDSTSSAYVTENTIYGYDRGATLELAGGLGVQLLNRIYHLVNKNSVIGSKIDEYLRAHNISRGLPKSNVLGDTKFMCNIDDVFATAATEDSALGQYAGKGIGSGSSEKMHFETESFGYLIQILCVVPLGGYVQGMRDCPINRYDFYQEEFDSLGMEPMSLSNFINRRYDYTTFKSDDTVFGFRPRYFGLKVENNLANGGFSLRSQQAQFLPYCLDRIFSVQGDSSMAADTEDYVSDEELRYIGRYENFGNYDRIFYDTTGLTENFIVHMIQDFSMYAPMKSISDSYDTFDKDVDDASINVQKA